MGQVIHDCLVVTSWNRGVILKARKAARENGLACLMSPINKATINTYYSFCIFSCGSKNGWPEKKDFIDRLESLKVELKHGNLEWCHVCYGQDTENGSYIEEEAQR